MTRIIDPQCFLIIGEVAQSHDGSRPLLMPRDESCNLDTMDDWYEVEEKIKDRYQA